MDIFILDICNNQGLDTRGVYTAKKRNSGTEVVSFRAVGSIFTCECLSVLYANEGKKTFKLFMPLSTAEL